MIPRLIIMRDILGAGGADIRSDGAARGVCGVRDGASAAASKFAPARPSARVHVELR